MNNNDETDCDHIILNIRGKSRNNAKLLGNENAESPDPRMKSSQISITNFNITPSPLIDDNNFQISNRK